MAEPSRHEDGYEGLRERARVALEPLRLNGAVKHDAWSAFVQHPDGVERIASEAMAGNDPPALFVFLLRQGAHRREPPVPRARKTGWRLVRGIAAYTYVEDPEGTDVLPDGYDTRPMRRPPPVPWQGGPPLEYDGVPMPADLAEKVAQLRPDRCECGPVHEPGCPLLPDGDASDASDRIRPG